MFKLLIVDDEFNIRDGFANAIEWNKYDVEVVGVAINGLDALGKIKELKPDIVITDIYMEKIDGLELAERIRNEYLETKVIIISGYDDFEYAKRAIDLKVYSYILKPVLPKQLIDIVCSLIDEIKADNKLKSKMSILEQRVSENYSLLFNGFLNDLIKGRVAGINELQQMEKFLNISLEYPCYYSIMFNVDGYRELAASQTPREMYILMLGIKEIIDEIFIEPFRSHTVLHDSGSIFTILCSNMVKSKKSDEMLYENLEKIKDSVKVIFGRTITAGIGGSTENILEISRICLSAERALEYRITAGKNSIIHIDDVTSMDKNSFIYPLDIEERVVRNLNLGDKAQLETSLSDFFDSISKANCSKDIVKTSVMQLFAAIVGRFMDIGFNIYKLYNKDETNPIIVLDKLDTINEMKSWLQKIILDVIDNIHNNIKTRARLVIEKAQEYIMKNHADPEISLVTIAEYLYINPSYFSKMYKEETGETYIEFLTNIRLDGAKKLLKESNLRIADIGSAVGYMNTQYFCTLFKKNTSYSPAEFRSKNK